jgi:hypothetical protein
MVIVALVRELRIVSEEPRRFWESGRGLGRSHCTIRDQTERAERPLRRVSTQRNFNEGVTLPEAL